MTISVEAYSRNCGPRALSAIIDETPTRSRPLPITCAGLLLEIQRHRRTHTAPGTSTDDMALALIRFGYRVEPYDTHTGEPIEPVEAFGVRLRAELDRDHARDDVIDDRESVRHPAANLIESAPEAQRPALLKQWRSRHSDRPRLQDWRSRSGTWLLSVDGDEFGHLIAVRDHRIVAGDDDRDIYAQWPVVAAFKINQRQE